MTLTTAATFTAGTIVGIAATLLTIRYMFTVAGKAIDEENRRERRAARDRHGRLRVVPNCKGGKA